MPTINEIMGRNIDQYTKKTNNKTRGFISYSIYQNPTLGTEIKFFIDTDLMQDPRKNWDPNYENTKYYISKEHHLDSLTTNMIDFEEILINYLNEYYIVNADSIPQPEFY